MAWNYLAGLLGPPELPPAIPDGFTAITNALPEDVYIVGFPKSGITWFQNLVAGVVYGVVTEFAPPVLASRELVPDVHAERYYRRYATPTFFKSHHLPRPEYQRVVYLLRDGRDAMVSYFHYLDALKAKPNLMQLVRKGAFPCKWHEHVEAWLANPFGARILTIRYEELKVDALKSLQRFCQFVGVDREPAFLETIAHSATLEKMRRRERDDPQDTAKPRWTTGRFFFRRGQVGSYRDEMPEEVQEAFLAEAGPTLKRTGYL